MKKRFVIIGLVALLGAGAASAWLTRPDRDYWLARINAVAASVQLDQFWNGKRAPAVLYGNVDIRQASLGFRVGGRLSELLVDEGSRVKKGDLLARLDDAPYRTAVAAAEANVAGLTATLNKLLAGPRPSEITQARAVLAQQQAALTNARLAYERARQLSSQGTVSQSVYDSVSAEQSAAVARVDAATAALNLLLDGSRQEDIAAARAALEAARSALAAAHLSLTDTELRAPEEGVVLSRVSEPGAIVGAGSTVFVLSLSQPVWVRAYIGETDLGRVQPGLPVMVTADSIGAAYEGTVGYISPVAEFTPKTVETPDLRTDLVYRIRIRVSTPGTDLRQGMPVTVTLPDVAGGG